MLDVKGSPEIEKEKATFKFFSEQKKSLLIGIIAGLLVLYFFDPILSFLGRILIKASGRLFVTYLDSIYEETATAPPNIGYLALSLFSSSVLGIGTGMLLGSILRRHEKLRKAGKSTAMKRVGIALGAILIALPNIITVDIYIRLKTESTFHQRLNIISPYISDQEVKIYVSKFAMMKSKSDFDSIMFQMEFDAKKVGILLPANKLYPI